MGDLQKDVAGLLKEKTGFVQWGHFVAQLMYFFITRRHSYFLKREP